MIKEKNQEFAQKIRKDQREQLFSKIRLELIDFTKV